MSSITMEKNKHSLCEINLYFAQDGKKELTNMVALHLKKESANSM